MSHTPNRGPFYKSPTGRELLEAYQAMADAVVAAQNAATILRGNGPPVNGVTGLGSTMKLYQNDNPAEDEAGFYMNIDPNTPSTAPDWRGIVYA